MPKLAGKVALVTGASKGIGAAVSERLAEDGAKVVVNYARSAREADEVVARIRARGGEAKAVQADVSRSSEARGVVERAVQEFGGLHILVNNAGIYEFCPLAEIDEDHFDRQFNLNVKGLLFATQAAVRAFGDEGGSVINIGSSITQSAAANACVYCGTKGAVDQMTKSLAAELGPRKILVNAILPGLVETEGVKAMHGAGGFHAVLVARTPLGRMGQPHEIASVVSFLASGDAGWITGQLIPVTGGLL